MSDASKRIEEIASRALTLYTRPTVAMELVRLAEEPNVDAKRLRDCVSKDPALTCKILRVVNSSLFGLNRPVADLNQAISLLGIKPLKLLVLGFNLPDALFAEVAARELRWYWTNTLTRAVAARLLAEQLWKQSGDEAFIAGLLQDVGILVLLRELGEPYVRFLTGVIEEKCHLASLEQDTLGFDHIQLSAALLARWQLPQRLVDSIAMPKRAARLARLEPGVAELPQILHLAEMLMQLVGQGRLNVLPDLLESGKVYRGMTRSKLATLVERLQPQVDQLGQVLSLELTDERNYEQTLLEAHRQMGRLSEQIAGEPASRHNEDAVYTQLLAHTDELSSAMAKFLRAGGSNPQTSDSRDARTVHRESGDAIDRLWSTTANDGTDVTGELALASKLRTTASHCRDRQQELSLLMIEPNFHGAGVGVDAKTAIHQARRALGIACASIDPEKLTFLAMSDRSTAVIIVDCERRAALTLAKNVIGHYGKFATPSSETNGRSVTTLSIGVATASVVPKNFDPARIIERAARCLSAARTCGISAVKSIEV